MVVSLPVVLGLISSATPSLHGDVRSVVAVTTLGLFVALLLMRQAQADSEARTLLALGMALLELLLLIALKLVVSGVMREHRLYRAEMAAWTTCSSESAQRASST